MKAPFPWFGGKQVFAERIVARLPEHRVYVEPCGGAAAVLCTKPRSHLEVYNDVDGDLVAFFRALRDQPAELERLLRLTPFSREEFVACASSYQELPPGLERTRRWYVAVGQSFNASRSAASWGGDRYGAANVTPPERWSYRLGALEGFAARLQGVQIDRRDWRSCLAHYDAPGVCFYLDPPYHPSTRSSGEYAHEWSAADHAELLALLPELAGMVVLSGYRCAPYDAALAEWRRVDFAVSLRMNGRGNQRRLESLWLSPAADAQLRLPLGVDAPLAVDAPLEDVELAV